MGVADEQRLVPAAHFPRNAPAKMAESVPPGWVREGPRHWCWRWKSRPVTFWVVRERAACHKRSERSERSERSKRSKRSKRSTS